MIPELMGKQFVLTYEFQLLFLVQIVLHGIPVNQAEADNGENGKVAKRDGKPSLLLKISFRALVFDSRVIGWNAGSNGIDNIKVFRTDNKTAEDEAETEE